MPSSSVLRTHKLIIILVDILCILAAYVSAFYIRYSGFPDRNWESFVSLLPWILLIGLFFISVYELYALDRKNSVWDVLIKIIIAVIFMSFLTMAASYLFREFALPRSIILIASVLTIAYMVVWKSIYLKLTRKNVVGKVLLIGDTDSSQKITKKIKHPLLKGTHVKHIQPNTPIEKIEQNIRLVDYVVLCTDIRKENKSQIIYHAMKNSKVVYVIPSLYELLMQQSQVTAFEDTLVMSVKPFGLSWDERVIKRIFDIFSSAIILVLSLPILLLVALAIKIENPKGKVIYRQKRLGRNNKAFTIYKFRSMVEGAEINTGPILAIDNDSRITKVGKLIRATRLDEFPQLFNVLKGDMSLVGPRPEREFFTKQLTREYYHYGYRNKVQPGITGYAQIMGTYSTEVEDKLRFDLYYIRNYSIWLDFVILLKTVVVLLDRSKSKGITENAKSNNVSMQVDKSGSTIDF